MRRFQRFKDAMEEVHKAEVVARTAMEQAFPLGATVYYPHGDYLRSGQVLEHCYDLRLRIQSPRGAEIVITASQVTRVEQ